MAVSFEKDKPCNAIGEKSFIKVNNDRFKVNKPQD